MTRAGIDFLDELRAEYDQGHVKPWQERIEAIEAEAAMRVRARLIAEFRDRSRRAVSPYEAQMWGQALSIAQEPPA